MKKKIKIILISIVVVVIVGFFARHQVIAGSDYVYTKLFARNVSSEDAAFTVTSKSISDEFVANAEIAQKKYLNKTIAISGTVTSINGLEIILDNTIVCNFLAPDNSIKLSPAVIKGRVVGFDDLMGELKLDECSVN